MKNTLETRLGIFFALAFIAAVIILEMLGGLEFFKGGYRVQALFSNVQELKEGNRVKMAGVPIGRVERIELAQNKVRVTMKLERGADIRTDSKATVKFAGLLGENFVSISFGSGIKAGDGTILEAAEQPDLSALMSKMDNVASGVENLTKSFTGDKIDNLLGPITDVIKQNQTNITEIFSNVRLVSGQFAEGKGTIGRMIKEEALYNSALGAVSNLTDTTTEIRGVIDQAKATMGIAKSVIDKVNAGEGTIGRLIKEDTLHQETTAAMTNLKEILQKINRGQGSVGKLVNDESFYKNVRLTLQKVDKATEGLEDQGPLSVLGIMVNSLF